MTKKEIPACGDVSLIWSEMQNNPELKGDREVWDHMAGLYAQRERTLIQEFLGEEDIDVLTHINYQKRE